MKLMSGVCRTLMTSHVGDLDAGVTADRASFGSGWSLVSNFPRQGAIAAMATQVPSTACFGAEPRWRLKEKHKYNQTRLFPPCLLGATDDKIYHGGNILCIVQFKHLFPFISLVAILYMLYSARCHTGCLVCTVFTISFILPTYCVKSVLCNILLMCCYVLALHYLQSKK